MSPLQKVRPLTHPMPAIEGNRRPGIATPVFESPQRKKGGHASLRDMGEPPTWWLSGLSAGPTELIVQPEFGPYLGVIEAK